MATSKTYMIRMTAFAVSPKGRFLPGKTYEVAADLRKDFVEGGYAEDVKAPAASKAKTKEPDNTGDDDGKKD